MTKQNRSTTSALIALAIKRAIPPGWVSVQLTIQLPHRLLARVRLATPVERGRMIEAGVDVGGLDGIAALNAEIEKNIKLAVKLVGSIAETHQLNARKAIDLENLENLENLGGNE